MSQSKTPNSQTEPSAKDVSTSQVAQECLKTIEAYRKSAGNRATELPEHVNSSQLSLFNAWALESEFMTLSEPTSPCSNSKITVSDMQKEPKARRSWNGKDTPVRSKRASSRGRGWNGEEAKARWFGLPWVVREQLSEFQLEGSLEKTLKLLRIFARDLKSRNRQSSLFTGTSSRIRNGRMSSPEQWRPRSCISGSSPSPMTTERIKLLGGWKVKFGVTKPVKQVKTSGDWFIAWGTTRESGIRIPPPEEEFDSYGTRIYPYSPATSPNSHFRYQPWQGNPSPRWRCRNLLLTDPNQFRWPKLYWLNPIGAGGRTSTRKPSESQ